MNGSLRAFGLQALGWTSLSVVLVQGLEAAELSMVLGTVVLAECLSCILNTYHFGKNGPKAISGQDDLARILLGWIVLCVLFISLFQFQLLPFYLGQPFAGLCLLALTLSLALLKFILEMRARFDILANARLILASGVVYSIIALGGDGADMLLQSLIFSNLLILFVGVALSRRSSRAHPLRSHSEGPADLLRHVDLLFIPIVFSSEDALLYLTARCLSIAVSASLACLGAKATVALVVARQRDNQIAFITTAARLNLGFLLIGGGVALAALTASPFLANAIQQPEGSLQMLLIWLLLGACAPVFFGATDILLVATERLNFGALTNFAAGLLLCTAAIGHAAPTPIFIAKCFATLNLIRVALAAIFLARFYGVWPGLTALMLRQIRLF